jgi:type I restriction enzyme R subunit
MMTMNNPNAYLEKEFRAQALGILVKLGYTAITPEECYAQRGGRYNVLLKDILRKKLHELNMFEYGGSAYRVKPANIECAIDELDANLADGLIKPKFSSDLGTYKTSIILGAFEPVFEAT